MSLFIVSRRDKHISIFYKTFFKQKLAGHNAREEKKDKRFSGVPNLFMWQPFSYDYADANMVTILLNTNIKIISLLLLNIY
jgi:hypothetical protein